MNSFPSKKDISGVKSFNDRVESLMSSLASNRTLKNIVENKVHSSWYLTLDRLSPNYGFGFGTQNVYDKGEYKIIGQKPYINFYDKEFEYLEHGVNNMPGFFKDYDECYSHLAKEVIYLMMRIDTSKKFATNIN